MRSKPTGSPKAEKKILIRHCLTVLLCLLSGLSIQARNFYISSSSGNDSYSSTQAQSDATPWRTIARLNSFFPSIVAGDNIYFKRGDTFYGTIIVTQSGASGNLITIGAYGSGDKPLISGLTTLSSWSAIGGGIYQAAAPAVKNTVNLVTLNGAPQAVGRYPNLNSANGGYLTYESYSGGTSITDNQLTTNWVGAEAVIRKAHYSMEKCKITSQSGGTLTYSVTPSINPLNTTKPAPVNGNNGFGYFIQRDPRTLDQLGEWYFNTSTKNMQMYFGSSSPSSYTVEVSTLDTLINIGTRNYINVNNIAFEGANVAAIYAASAGNLTIQSCDMNLMGGKGVLIFNSPNIIVDGVTTNNALCGAIDVTCRQQNNVTVRNCVIKNTGMMAGMGSFWDDNDYKAISVSVNSTALVEYNEIQTSGFIAIQFRGSDYTIKNNFINNFNIVKDDGGAIYTYQTGTDASPGTVFTNRVIRENIVMNGIGASGGTSGNIDVDGIFLDGRVTNVDIINNTLANIGVNGIYANNPININIRGNTSFNNGCAFGMARYTLGYFSNLTVKQNIFYPKFSDQNDVFYQDLGINVPVAGTIQSLMQKMGNIDSNYYSTPGATGIKYYYALVNGGAWTFPKPLSFEGWKSYTNHDKSSKIAPRPASYKLNKLVGSTTVTNGQFSSSISNITPLGLNFLATFDNTSKITGTGSLKITPIISSTDFTSVAGDVKSVSSAKKYILRFTTRGSATNGVLHTYLANSSSLGDISSVQAITPMQEANFGTGKQVNQFLFTAPATTSAASFVIELQQASGATYIDDIAFYEADATVLDIDDQLHFEYNASKANRTITLDDNYIGVDGTSYSGSLTLAPYASKILIRDTSKTVRVVPLEATATAPAINCFGSSATVTVAASGGVSPYKGTGTFSATGGKGTLRLSVPSPVSGNSTMLYGSVGAVSNAKSYMLKFSTLGTTANGKASVYLRQGASPYSALTPVQEETFGTSRIDHELYFNGPDSEENASFLIDIEQASGTTYLDNISFFETDTSGSAIGSNLVTNGQFESNVSGITSWSPTSNHLVQWDTTGKISNINYYSVTDAASNSSVAFVNIDQPAAGPLKATATAGVIRVNGGTTTVVVAATGGTAPYTGTGSFIIKAGTYNYTITDAKGCSVTTGVIITQPASTATSLEADASANDISCFGGTTNVTVSASGGTGPYTGTGTFTVTAGKGSLKLSVQNPVAGNSTFLYASIGAVSKAKNYVIMFSTLGTSASGSLNVYLRQTANPYANLTAMQSATYGTVRKDHEFLFSAPTASSSASFLIDVDQASGTTYIDNIAFFEADADGNAIGNNLFSDGQFETDISSITSWSADGNETIEWDATSKINNIYYYTVTDQLNNTSVVAINTSQPASALRATATAGTIRVFGGSTTVTLAATGGTSPYTGTGSFNVTAGSYNYRVTDANGCITTVAITVAQPSATSSLVASAAMPGINCFGGNTTTTVSASGGTAPYTGTGSFSVNAGHGSLRISVADPIDRAYTLIYSSIGAITSGQSYLLRFSTLGTTSNGALLAGLRQTRSPWSNLIQLQSASFGNSRVDHQFIFNPGVNEDAASFIIQILQSSGTVYIDNIAVFESTAAGVPTSDNLYTDGQFESGNLDNITTWSSYNGTDNHVAVLDLTSKIANTYYFPVTDDNGVVSVATGTTSQPATALALRASVNGTTVTITASGGTSPYTGTGTFTDVTAGPHSYTVRDASGCSSVVTVTVGAAARTITQQASPKTKSTGSTSVDSIAANSRTTPVEGKEGNLLKIISYPSPAVSEFNLAVQGGTREMLSVMVQAIDGKMLYKTKGYSNSMYMFGSNFAPGIYILKVTQGKNSQVLRIVKGRF